jgi:CRISPR type III-B/RAMP module RAMP protein Cmr1
MISTASHLVLLTPAFLGGARPDLEAELRVPAIRGQLRWWFRTLGGFVALHDMPVAEQERCVFGTVTKERRQASPLILRLQAPNRTTLSSRVVKTPEELQAALGPASGYLLYPLQRKNRAVFDPSHLPQFDLIYSWRGDRALWDSVQALVHLLGHWGSLGFRSRRAMGALGFAQDPPSLAAALRHFADPQSLVLKQMPAQDAPHAIHVLAQWLRKWRNYGRSPNHLNPFQVALTFTRQDHDAGLNLHTNQVYRPALGLPIHQRFHQGQAVDWHYARHTRPDAEGHFASPILLRPYRTENRRWLALVIFVDAHKWPAGKKAWLNDQTRSVSLDLYEAMKNDPALRPFPVAHGAADVTEPPSAQSS